MSKYISIIISPELIAKREKRVLDRLAIYKKHGKRCSSCWHYKPVENYTWHGTAPDRLTSVCRACTHMRDLIRKTGNLATWHLVRDALRSTAPPAPTGPADGRRAVGPPELRKYRYKNKSKKT